MEDNRNDSIVIVGAGFGGLGLAIRLKRAGIHDFTVLERAAELGGVWRDNVYPGVACDVESLLYSYSFAPSAAWSRTFAPQREILAYLKDCVERFGVGAHLRLGTGVAAARFDERSGLWAITTTTGEVLTARLLISAAGHALSRPVYPELPGRTSFEGRAFHSARWDSAYPLEGKRVAVIGTGASGVQLASAISSRVAHLSLFQRTPAWILPKGDRPFSSFERRLLQRVPGFQRLLRFALYWRHELLAPGFVRHPGLLRLVSRWALRNLRKHVRDPELRRRLTPRYTLGCKRVLPSDDFYSAIQRPNVELVDAPIEAILPKGIRTRDGLERGFDAIVYATGFEAAEATAPFELTGRGGATLDEAWRDGIEAYLGTAIAGFPNLFLIVGPNVGLGHSSMILMMESQFAYVLDAVRKMRAGGLASVEVRREVQRRFNERLQRRLSRTVWNTGGCVSWYRTRTGKNTTLWPGTTFMFRWQTRRFQPAEYECVQG